ncbi:hypothetical protein XENOCAPTIV_009435 [Xenoophorus captivus]|uniref:Uncharacterized protein n=1 Tax=Xenoophorus captivus TaxID=1517983 RepID=A0ABV0RGI0_9TELE
MFHKINKKSRNPSPLSSDPLPALHITQLVLNRLFQHQKTSKAAGSDDIFDFCLRTCADQLASWHLHSDPKEISVKVAVKGSLLLHAFHHHPGPQETFNHHWVK